MRLRAQMALSHISQFGYSKGYCSTYKNFFPEEKTDMLKAC